MVNGVSTQERLEMQEMHKHQDKDRGWTTATDQLQALMQALAEQEAALIGEGKGKAYRVIQSQALIHALHYRVQKSQV